MTIKVNTSAPNDLDRCYNVGKYGGKLRYQLLNTVCKIRQKGYIMKKHGISRHNLLYYLTQLTVT